MGKILVTVYDSLPNAQAARDALLASGISASDIRLAAQEDEAGPPSGNFALDYKDTEKGDDRSVLDSLLTRGDPNEGQGHTEVEWRGNLTLIVNAQDEQQFERACDITRRFGAVDADERAPGGRPDVGEQ